jgi:tetratricopeptide (TPR) repeat protein
MRWFFKMTRQEIIKLAKYGEECLQDSYNSPEIKEKLLNLAEEQFNILIMEYKAECIEPMVGYLYGRIGEVKYNQKEYLKAEKYYLDALANLIVRGEYCQDRAQAHLGLAKTYMKLANEDGAREHYIRAIHIFDSLAMDEKIHQQEKEFIKLKIRIKDVLPAKQINEKGEPTKCRECGGSKFKKIRVENEKLVVYDCIDCGCRNVIILDMLELIQNH